MTGAMIVITALLISAFSVRLCTAQNCAYKPDSSGNVVVPEGVKEIPHSAMWSCTGMLRVTIANSVTKIGTSAFANNPQLNSITWGSGLVEIGENAFYKCSGLKSISLPNSLEKIMKGGFYQCQGLTQVTFGSGLISIGELAFVGSRMQSLSFPHSLASIG